MKRKPEQIEEKWSKITPEYLEKISYKNHVKFLKQKQDKEYAICFDVHGNKLFEQEGTWDAISFTEYNALLLRTDGYLLLHNHPIKDWGLSLSDIITALSNKLHCMQAITHQKVYSFNVNRIAPEHVIDLVKDYWLTSGLLPVVKQAPRDEINHIILSLVVKSFQRYFNYEVKQHKEDYESI